MVASTSTERAPVVAPGRERDAQRPERQQEPEGCLASIAQGFAATPEHPLLPRRGRSVLIKALVRRDERAGRRLLPDASTVCELSLKPYPAVGLRASSLLVLGDGAVGRLSKHDGQPCILQNASQRNSLACSRSTNAGPGRAWRASRSRSLLQ